MARKSLNRFLSAPSALFGFLATPFYFLRFFWFTLVNRSSRFLRYYPGHFASLIPSGREVGGDLERVVTSDVDNLPGIDIRADNQRQLLEEFSVFYDEFPFPDEPGPECRYYANNDFFRFYDGFVLFAMMKRYTPKRIVEIGSGFSSALVLDVNEQSFDGSLNLTFVEPYPERLYELINKGDSSQCRIIESNVQEVPQSVFSELSENDFLLIDSSHVFRVGGDLNMIFNQIIPTLPKGVIVHIHDIFWPFEYPKNITLTGRLWNECYIVRAFLQFNAAFEIVFWNDYVTRKHSDFLSSRLPQCHSNPGGSLWIRRCR